MSASLDRAEFDRALKEYLEVTKKDMHEEINKRAFNVALRAIGQTPKANPQAIESLPQKPWWGRYIAKRITQGFILKSRKYSAYYGEKITTHREAQYTEADAQKVSAKIIAARKRSIAFIAAGWIPAVKRLAPFVKNRGNVRVLGAKQYGQDKGSALPARESWSPAAYIVNSVKGAAKIGEDALLKAIDAEAKDMREYLARKMQQNAQRYSAK